MWSWCGAPILFFINVFVSWLIEQDVTVERTVTKHSEMVFSHYAAKCWIQVGSINIRSAPTVARFIQMLKTTNIPHLDVANL